MTTTPEALRASEAEREHSAALLREHCQQGRLSIDELAERLGVAFAARTQGELDALLGDLPAQGPQATAGATRRHVRTFLLVNALLVSIWLLTGAGYFWPMWPILGWGIGIIPHHRSPAKSGRCRASRAWNQLTVAGVSLSDPGLTVGSRRPGDCQLTR